MKAKKAAMMKQSRIERWERMVANATKFETKVQQRIQTGGYKRPGSNKRFHA